MAVAPALVSGAAALATSVLAGATPARPAERDTIHKPDYVGTIEGIAPKGEVLFRITMKNGHPVRARFQGRNVELFCDDGTYPRVTFQPISFRFRDGNVFDGDRYFLSDGNQEYYRVRGRMFGGGSRAQGYLLYIADSLDPPRPGNPEMPDCSTLGKSTWNAERVRN
jgi:hypothetical protein